MTEEISELPAETLASVRRYNTSKNSRSPRRRGAPSQFSGRGVDDRDPQLVGPTVTKLMADQGWEHRSAVGGVLGRWPAIAGADLASHVKPESFDDNEGRLVLRAETTTWATQVRMLIPMLQARLDEEVGQGIVRTIDVLGPVGRGNRKGRTWVKGRGDRDTFG
jgi:predicted nucleic acid-binding Zn ribbon protein